MAAGATTKSQGLGKTSVKDRQKVNVFHQRLGSLTYHQACQLLGDEGGKLLQLGSQSFEVQSDRDVYLGGDLFRVRVEDARLEDGWAIATVTLHSGREKQRHIRCDHCETPCEHLGAALDFLLDAKTLLGLAMPPDESVPLENLTSEELLRRALASLRGLAATPAKLLD